MNLTELMFASQVMVQFFDSYREQDLFAIYGDGEWTAIPVPARIAEADGWDGELLGIEAVGDKVYVWRRTVAHTVSHIFVYHSGEWTILTPLQEPYNPTDEELALSEKEIYAYDFAVVDDRLYSLTLGSALYGTGENSLAGSDRYIRVCVYDTTNHSFSSCWFETLPSQWYDYFAGVTFCALQGNLIMLRLAKDDNSLRKIPQSAILRQAREANFFRPCSEDSGHFQPLIEPRPNRHSPMPPLSAAPWGDHCIGVAVNPR